ncbi:MAG: SpoIIE family protein phosphatase [Bacteroidota bacterium]
MLLLCLPVSNLYAQKLNFRNFNGDNGLNQAYIYDISQLPDGRLILCTGEGLAIYNGRNFKMLRMAQGLAEDFTTAGCVDKKGKLWVGHYQNGISCGENLKMHPVHSSFLEEGVRVNDIACDSSGDIWIATSQNMLRIPAGTEFPEKVESVEYEVFSITISGKNTLIAGTADGFLLINANGKKPVAGPTLFKEAGPVTSVFADNKGNIWAGTFEGNLYRTIVSGNKLNILNTYPSPNKSFGLNGLVSGSAVKAITIDKSGAIWAATYGADALRRLSPQPNGSYRDENFTEKNELPDNYLLSAYVDLEGNLWLGTFGGGLSQLVPERFLHYDRSSGFPSEDVSAVCTGAGGTIWVGLEKGLINFDPFSGRKVLHNKKTGFCDDKVTALAKAGRDIWAGTANSGIFRLSPNGFWESMNEKFELRSKETNCITQSADGIIYAGTIGGLFAYSPKADSFKVYSTAEGLVHNNIRYVFPDSKGRIWFAAHGAGLCCLENQTFTIHKDIPGLKSFKINTITEDLEGLIWFATEGDGIFSFDGKNTFRNYTREEGLVSNYCYSISSDKEGTIRVGHRGGVSCLPANEKLFRSYGREQGFAWFEANPGACCFDESGRPWWGTAKGLVCYDSPKLITNTTLPLISLDRILVNGKEIPSDKGFYLDYEKYAIRFDFTGICLTDPSRLRYRYILDGFETEWNEVGASARSANYPRLEDGKYTFKVLALNNDGIPGVQVASVNFRIGMPIWKRWPFYIALVALSASGMYGFTWTRTRAISRRAERLEAVVTVRTAELRDERDKLEKSKTHIEEINRDITESINYARRIQDAVLPSRQLSARFPDNVFILHRPREIVSGDFYWFTELSDGYIVVVADSTGHGVPGAFMSLIGTTLLNQIVLESGEESPAGIISRMNREVVGALHQDTGRDSLRDGMDMAVCRIYNDKRVVFSGAGRPMYIVSKGKTEELSGSYWSVGGNFYEREKNFSDTVYQGAAGDMIYLCTDGYADQFGGPENRRFMTRRLKSLISESAALPLPEQLISIEQAHNLWKENRIQTDDILLLGIRL